MLKSNIEHVVKILQHKFYFEKANFWERTVRPLSKYARTIQYIHRKMETLRWCDVVTVSEILQRCSLSEYHIDSMRYILLFRRLVQLCRQKTEDTHKRWHYFSNDFRTSIFHNFIKVRNCNKSDNNNKSDIISNHDIKCAQYQVVYNEITNILNYKKICIIVITDMRI